MKKIVVIFCMTSLMMVVSLLAFGQDKKAKEDLRAAKVDSAADFQKFKTNAEWNIGENRRSLVALKMKKSSDNVAIKEEFNKQVLLLEKRNNDLNKKIAESDNVKTTMWTSFKTEFNHDMDELSDAINDIGSKNKR
jgi:hypothetical protein